MLRLQVLLFGLVLLGTACSKEEGIGGRATIKGKVHATEYNLIGAEVDQYFASEQRVYIVYGADGGYFDDEVRTDYEGRYEFNYLYKGSYSVYVYSDCEEPCPGGEEVIIKTAELGSNKETLELETFEIRK